MMAIDWLLKELVSRFNQTVSRKLIAAYRENLLLWRELNNRELPTRWFDFTNNDSNR